MGALKVQQIIETVNNNNFDANSMPEPLNQVHTNNHYEKIKRRFWNYGRGRKFLLIRLCWYEWALVFRA
jgi:hypothetical protein